MGTPEWKSLSRPYLAQSYGIEFLISKNWIVSVQGPQNVYHVKYFKKQNKRLVDPQVDYIQHTILLLAFCKSSLRGHSQRTSAKNGDFQTPPLRGCPQW